MQPPSREGGRVKFMTFWNKEDEK